MLFWLQSMVNLYADYSSGYFDLVISDECHRSIYGQWIGVLRHFDGVQVGLTATPCVADPDSGGDDEDKAFVRDTLRFFEVDAPTFSYKSSMPDPDGPVDGTRHGPCALSAKTSPATWTGQRRRADDPFSATRR